MNFYNTTAENGETLVAYEHAAGEQNDTVLWVFHWCGAPLSPSQVQALWPGTKPPLTSIRRAITTLTQAGALVKTEVKRKGVYGRMEHVWTLPEARP